MEPSTTEKGLELSAEGLGLGAEGLGLEAEGLELEAEGFGLCAVTSNEEMATRTGAARTRVDLFKGTRLLFNTRTAARFGLTRKRPP